MSSSVDQLKRLVATWTEKLSMGVESVALRRLDGLWATHSSDGRLTFDLEVLDLDEDLQGYVVVCELVRMRMPAGRLRDALMGSLLGDTKALEARLASWPGRRRAAAPSAPRAIPPPDLDHGWTLVDDATAKGPLGFAYVVEDDGHAAVCFEAYDSRYELARSIVGLGRLIAVLRAYGLELEAPRGIDLPTWSTDEPTTCAIRRDTPKTFEITGPLYLRIPQDVLVELLERRGYDVQVPAREQALDDEGLAPCGLTAAPEPREGHCLPFLRGQEGFQMVRCHGVRAVMWDPERGVVIAECNAGGIHEYDDDTYALEWTVTPCGDAVPESALLPTVIRARSPDGEWIVRGHTGWRDRHEHGSWCLGVRPAGKPLGFEDSIPLRARPIHVAFPSTGRVRVALADGTVHQFGHHTPGLPIYDCDYVLMQMVRWIEGDSADMQTIGFHCGSCASCREEWSAMGGQG